MNLFRKFVKAFQGVNEQKIVAGLVKKELNVYDKNIIDSVSPYTMTSSERILTLINSVKYLQKKSIKGSFVECGVWKGGSMLAIAMTLDSLNVIDRDLYLFDTFSGMTDPSLEDIDHTGVTASELLTNEDSMTWCLAGIDEVKKTMKKSRYPEKHIHYVVGDVLTTLPDNSPENIALLRLDTDWYESTKYELEVLYPRLSLGGILIIDDYGHWKGAKKAIDEYFKENNININLCKIDYTGRIAIKH